MRKQYGQPTKRYPKHMRISELSERTGVPAPTIRFYTRLGLLPAPLKTSKTMSYYSDEHLERLKHIHSLKENGHSLASIAEMIAQDDSPAPADQDPKTVFTSKRDTIIQAAIDLFRKNGYDTPTINDIVDHAGIGKGTFYQYFKDKEDLFLECADNVFIDVGRDDPSIRDEQDGLKRLGKRSRAFVKSHLHMIDMLNLVRGASTKDSRRFKNLPAKILKDMIEPIQDDLTISDRQGNLPPLDLHLLAYLLMGGAEYMYYYLQMHPECDAGSTFRKGQQLVFNRR